MQPCVEQAAVAEADGFSRRSEGVEEGDGGGWAGGGRRSAAGKAAGPPFLLWAGSRERALERAAGRVMQDRCGDRIERAHAESHQEAWESRWPSVKWEVEAQGHEALDAVHGRGTTRA